MLLIDLKQAFDNVNRDKLFLALRKRCRNNTDEDLIDLIESLHRGGKVYIGDNEISITRG